MTNNISTLKNCYGCSLCASICPKHIISLKLSKTGFYQPVIVNDGDCVQCGLCLKVCAYTNALPNIDRAIVQGFATWSKEPVVRRMASSGGTGFELARLLLHKGYKVIAVRYNAEQQRAEHYIAETEEDLIQSMGSKYIQSFSEEAFRAMKKGGKYLVTGTPCQIASMRRYVQMKKMEDDVVLMDFFCHGVPSKLLWDKYVAELEPKIGKVIYASWRNKRAGWHDSWAMGLDGDKQDPSVDWHDSYNTLIRGGKTFYSRKRSEGDLFYKFFLSDVCFNKACYKDCKFKNLQSAADIRIGDLWGHKYAENEDGVTGVLTFTERGEKVLRESNVEIVPEITEVVTEGQLKGKIKSPYYYTFLIALLRSRLNLGTIYRIVQMFRIGRIIGYKLHLK